MRDILAIVLIGFGAYWIWNKFSEEERKLDEAEPTVRSVVREKILHAREEAGFRRGKGGGIIQ